MDFPSSFLWGAALSSYQTEGENFNTDWYLWEKKRELEPAARASNHYHLFENDFELAKELNFNCLRLSVEWARICPRYHIYSEKEFGHYKEVIGTLLSLNLKPIVNLHHFTNPIWFSERGGWLSSKNIDFFLHYLKKVVESFKTEVEYWLIFNEPLVYIYNSFVLGIWPPGRRSLIEAKKVLDNIISAYRVGYQEIKNIYSGNSTTAKVSFSKHMRIFSPCPTFNTGLNNFSAFLRDGIFNFRILDHLCKKGYLDFIAMNYYCKEYVKFKGLFGVGCDHGYHQERKNYLNWYVYPKGLYEFLIRLKRYNLPIIIMENGTAEKQNILYEDYLISHLKSVAKAISAGVNVQGYLWWSLIDNFEWHEGFGPRFGLIEVNYRDFSRKIRPFALTYAKICKENRLEIKT
ncbi:MAG: family 1 glycosylhydrolase [Candidatus Omnitrophota bacterium]|nr:family 1 glycosylhydrolase [Candidatus Omnitrophota bacterium]